MVNNKRKEELREMGTLYELTDVFLNLWELIDDPEADEDVILDTLEGIDGEIEDKADGYAKVIAQANAEAAALKSEALRITNRRKTIENNISRMKASLQNAMELTGKTKFKTSLFSFSVANNGGKAPIVIDDIDPDKLPEEYKIVTISPNTEAIRNALEEGKKLSFAHIGERGRSLRIK